MNPEEIKEHIRTFVSKHECRVTDENRKKGMESTKFTIWGSKAGRNALLEVIDMLDDDMKMKVIEKMKRLDA